MKTSCVRKTMCATCPFRQDSPTRHLVDDLTQSAIFEGNRVCHSTGQSPFYGRTQIPEAFCRGARDVQLQVYHGLGVLSAPTDEAWNKALSKTGKPIQPVVSPPKPKKPFKGNGRLLA